MASVSIKRSHFNWPSHPLYKEEYYSLPLFKLENVETTERIGSLIDRISKLVNISPSFLKLGQGEHFFNVLESFQACHFGGCIEVYIKPHIVVKSLTEEIVCLIDAEDLFSGKTSLYPRKEDFDLHDMDIPQYTVRRGRIPYLETQLLNDIPVDNQRYILRNKRDDRWSWNKSTHSITAAALQKVVPLTALFVDCEYEVQNGLSGMMFYVIVKLCCQACFEEETIRAVMGMCQEHFIWIDFALFKEGRRRLNQLESELSKKRYYFSPGKKYCILEEEFDLPDTVTAQVTLVVLRSSKGCAYFRSDEEEEKRKEREEIKKKKKKKLEEGELEEKGKDMKSKKKKKKKELE